MRQVYTGAPSFPYPLLFLVSSLSYVLLSLPCPFLHPFSPFLPLSLYMCACACGVCEDADAKLHWYDVSWDPADLSWADFRGVVLGATDPVTAASGSLRRDIYDQYQALGLTEEPNVGLNGKDRPQLSLKADRLDLYFPS